jgi:WD40 repeat protein
MKNILGVLAGGIILFILILLIAPPALIFVLGALAGILYFTHNVGIPWLQRLLNQSRRGRRGGGELAAQNENGTNGSRANRPPPGENQPEPDASRSPTDENQSRGRKKAMLEFGNEEGPPLRFHVFVSGWWFVSLLVAFVLLGRFSEDVKRPQPYVFSKHTSRINAIAFNAAANRLASGGADQTIQVWDTSSKALDDNKTAPLFALEPHWSAYAENFTSLAYTPKRSLIAVGSSDKTIRLWDVQGSAPPRQLMTPSGGAISVLTFSPDGSLLASGSSDNQVRVWNTSDGALFRTLPGNAPITSLAFTSDGRFLAAGSAAHTIYLWRVSDGVPFGKPRALSDSTEAVSALAFADDHTLLSISQDRSVMYWEFEPNAPDLRAASVMGQPVPYPENWHRPSDFMDAVAFAPSGLMFATGDSDHIVRLWSIQEQTVTAPDGKTTRTGFKIPQDGRQIGKHDDGITRLVFHPSFDANDPARAILVSGGKDKTIRLWNLKDPRQDKTLTGHDNTITGLAYNPEADLIVSSSNDKTVRTWKVSNAHNRKIFDTPIDKIDYLAFSHDGKYLVAASSDGYVRTWKLEDKSLVLDVRWSNAVITSLAVSDDRIAVGSASGAVRVWGIDDSAYQELKPFAREIVSLAFSPNGQVLSAATEDQVYVGKVNDLARSVPVVSGDQAKIMSLSRSKFALIALPK